MYFQIPGGNKYLREIEKLAVQEMEEGQVIILIEVKLLANIFPEKRARI